MEFDYISFLKDLYKLKLYLLKHEKASTIDELSDYLSLALMTRDRFGINIEEELYSNKKHMYKCMHNYNMKQLDILLNFVNSNCDDLFQLSTNINDAINPNIFDCLFVEYGNFYNKVKKYSEKEFKDLIYPFFAQYGDNTLKAVKDLIENKRLLVGAVQKTDDVRDHDAFTAGSAVIGKTYILTYIDSMILENIVLLVHELGHAVDLQHTMLSQSKKYTAADPMCEVPSCFFEISFADYLVQNRIETDLANNIILAKLSAIPRQFLKYHKMLTSPSDFLVNTDGIVVFDNGTGLKGSNLRNDLYYFIGTMMAANALMIHKDNPKEFNKKFSDFLGLKQEQTLKQNVETLGINYDEFLSCELIKPYYEEKSNELIKRYKYLV